MKFGAEAFLRLMADMDLFDPRCDRTAAAGKDGEHGREENEFFAAATTGGRYSEFTTQYSN